MIDSHKATADERPSANTTGWLTTFNDLVTLLMVFFVLVFSTSSIDTSRLKDFSGALQSGFGVLRQGRQAPVQVVDSDQPVVPESRPEIRENEEKAQTTAVDAAGIDPRFKALDEMAGIQVGNCDQGILITLEGQLLFDFGKADLHPHSHPLMGNIAAVIRDGRYPIQIEGHTDNVPIQTRRYPSNWELSTARAVQVLRHFVEREGLAPHRFSAVGYGDARPRFDNTTAEGRTMNRRVEIILVTENGGKDVD